LLGDDDFVEGPIVQANPGIQSRCRGGVQIRESLEGRNAPEGTPADRFATVHSCRPWRTDAG
jgi:hypothetical protein